MHKQVEMNFKEIFIKVRALHEIAEQEEVSAEWKVKQQRFSRESLQLPYFLCLLVEDINREFIYSSPALN